MASSYTHPSASAASTMRSSTCDPQSSPLRGAHHARERKRTVNDVHHDPHHHHKTPSPHVVVRHGIQPTHLEHERAPASARRVTRIARTRQQQHQQHKQRHPRPRSPTSNMRTQFAQPGDR
eukprot:2241252-Rhodomonas_salina.3